MVKVPSLPDFRQYFGPVKIHDAVRLVVGETVFEVNGIVISQQSSVLLDLVCKQSEVYFDQFVGEEQSFRECIELLYGGEVDINMTNIGTILKFAAVNEIEGMFKLGLLWARNNLARDNLFEMINHALMIERIGYAPNIQQVFWPSYTLLESCLLLIQKDVQDDLVNISESWKLTDKKNFIKFLIDKDIINYSLPVLASWVENEADIKLIINELQEKGIELGVTADRKGSLELLDRMGDKVESFEISKKINMLQKVYILSGGLTNDDDDEISMVISGEKAGLVVGHKGAKIKAIQRKTKAHLSVGKHPLMDEMCSVTISGSPAECKAAVKLVHELTIPLPSLDEANSSEDHDSTHRFMWLKTPKLKLFDGGTFEWDIKNDFELSSDVDITEEIVVEDETLIVLTGPEESTKTAMDFIYHLSESGNPQHYGSYSGGGYDEDGFYYDGRGYGRDGVRPRTKSSCKSGFDCTGGYNDRRGTRDMWVRSSKIGLVIGRGGWTMKDIMRDYGAKVTILKEEVKIVHYTGCTETKIELTGTKEDTAAARQFIYRLVGAKLTGEDQLCYC